MTRNYLIWPERKWAKPIIILDGSEFGPIFEAQSKSEPNLGYIELV